MPDVALSNGHPGTAIRLNNSSSGGHLNSNLNMFGAGFTRIFMGGHGLKGSTMGNSKQNSNKTTAPIPVNAATLASQSLVATANGPYSHLNNNVAYSTQKFPAYLADSTVKTSPSNGSSYSVNGGKVQAHGFINPSMSVPVSSAANGQRQYYASTDLMVKSPKMVNKNVHQTNLSSLEQVAPSMTSNTIYK